jgi:hypothetical protein
MSDMDYEQTVCEYDAYGCVDERKVVGKSKLSCSTYQSGMYYPLGKVIRRGKEPTLHDQEKAWRSKAGYVALGSYAELEIELDPINWAHPV